MGRKSREKHARRRERDRDPPWTPFEPASVSPDAWQHRVTVLGEDFLVYKNSRYTVMVRRVGGRDDWPDMIHLSIRRNDRDVVRDWRELQRIKNELVGPEHEAVELYPAESRLVDGANQFHLYVLADAKHRFPFGYRERLVSESNTGGAVQRPWPADCRPPDLRVVTEEEMRRAKARSIQ